jgi:hypothetical protein
MQEGKVQNMVGQVKDAGRDVMRDAQNALQPKSFRDWDEDVPPYTAAQIRQAIRYNLDSGNKWYKENLSVPAILIPKGLLQNTPLENETGVQ